MAWESLRPDMELSAVAIKLDQKNGNVVERYRVTEKAIYLPEKRYIPLDAVEKFQIRDPRTDGGAFGFVVFYGTEKPQELALEKKRDAQMLAYLVMSSRQGIKWEEYIP